MAAGHDRPILKGPPQTLETRTRNFGELEHENAELRRKAGAGGSTTRWRTAATSYAPRRNCSDGNSRVCLRPWDAPNTHAKRNRR